MVGIKQDSARGVAVTLATFALILASCGGGDTSDTTTPAEPDDQVTTSQPATETTTADNSTTATPAETESATLEVDEAALPSEPTGYDIWSADMCSLYSPEDLDGYFTGKGGLASTEPLDNGCRWAVEGFPRSHYVDVEIIDDPTDAIFVVVEQIDADGTDVDIAHGPEDIVAVFPAPDGNYVRVLIHGDFEAPSGPLDHYLDDAAAGLAGNLISRF